MLLRGAYLDARREPVEHESTRALGQRGGRDQRGPLRRALEPAGGFLDVFGTGPDNVYAVGYEPTGLFRFDGTSWTRDAAVPGLISRISATSSKWSRSSSISSESSGSMAACTSNRTT